MRNCLVLLASLLLIVPFPICADDSTDLKQLLIDLKTNEGVKKRKAVKQITIMGSAAKAAAPSLINLLERDRDALVRRGAAEALGVVGGDAKPTIAALAKAMNDSDLEVMTVASVSLSKYGKQAVPVLQEALADKDNQVRRHAAEALAKIGPDAKDAVPDLLKAYQSEGKQMKRNTNTVKASFVEALGAIGPDAKEAIPIFEAFLAERNPDRELRRVITEAMRKIKK
ncbi:MAG TPA: HEAT repeat domain-containing protein [Gemmatales bacterium]|nr:HEAT repeat domain-containing protein [Gemmatales bacterium]